jgi:fructose/tagatose bisphosphate aldolase
MTDPIQAAKFVDDTKVDTLAVAVGSFHGIPVSPKIKKVLSTLKEHIDLHRLKLISEYVKVPLVLHGASGVPDEQMAKAVGFGVAVFNIDTDLRVAFSKNVRSFLNKHPEAYDPRKILKTGAAAVQAMAESKIKVLKATNKAIKINKK